ncbi:MAG: carboxypeptidase regulatory-like domain-containing protein, partial [Bacteroidetes bacterium]|nr:carboxypeptidase regulatory-like domain-containing protein [Bacteroidota bacterium]
MRFKTSDLLIILFAIIFTGGNQTALSQTSAEEYLSLDGLVYGYSYDYSKKLLKKDREIKIEGVLDNVTISLVDKGKVIRTAKTNSNGLFYIKVKTGKSYDLEFSKEGYSAVLLTVDLTEIPKEISVKGISFSGAELLLNSFQSKTKTVNPSFGKLFYDTKEHCLNFAENSDVTKRQKEYINNSASLMLRSVQKNKRNKNDNTQLSDGKAQEKISAKINTAPEEIALKTYKKSNSYDTINKILAAFKLRVGDKRQVSAGDIESLQNSIKEARAQYEKDRLSAVTPQDSLILKEQEYLLNAAESELTKAKELIELQNNKISDQNKLLLLAVACVILMSVLLLIIFRFNKEKKKTYLLLKEKNKKITDSINYASRIQESILPSDDEVKKQLPQSFIYFQPKDVVSGDFYWVATVKEK